MTGPDTEVTSSELATFYFYGSSSFRPLGRPPEKNTTSPAHTPPPSLENFDLSQPGKLMQHPSVQSAARSTPARRTTKSSKNHRKNIYFLLLWAKVEEKQIKKKQRDRKIRQSQEMAREVLRLVGAGAALATAVLLAVVLAGSGGWPFPLPKWLGSSSSPAAFASTTMGHASGGDEGWEWREVWFGNGASVAFAIRPGHGPPVLLLHGTSPPPPAHPRSHLTRVVGACAYLS
jgi:hypothetical protein